MNNIINYLAKYFPNDYFESKATQMFDFHFKKPKLKRNKKNKNILETNDHWEIDFYGTHSNEFQINCVFILSCFTIKNAKYFL